jgi:hypothetical protein
VSEDWNFRDELTAREELKRRRLLLAAFSSPIVLAIIPFLIFVAVSILLSGWPVFAVSSLLFGILLSLLGFLVGLAFSAYFLIRRRRLTRETQKRLAARGIRASELAWFKSEIRPSEKRAMKMLKEGDSELYSSLTDAIATRISASRILSDARRELAAARLRNNRVKKFTDKATDEFRQQLSRDIEKISEIIDEAKDILRESESRIQILEAAAARGGKISDSELVLKKLRGRFIQLPQALEEAKIKQEILAELESKVEESRTD